MPLLHDCHILSFNGRQQYSARVPHLGTLDDEQEVDADPWYIEDILHGLYLASNSHLNIAFALPWQLAMIAKLHYSMVASHSQEQSLLGCHVTCSPGVN